MRVHRPAIALAGAAALAACGSGSRSGGGDPAGGAQTPPADPSNPPPPDDQPPPTTTPGPPPADPQPPPGPPTLVARKLGGAGDEWARGVAACGDGTAVAVSSFGPAAVVDRVDMYGNVIDDHDQPWLGVARLEPDGRTRWSRAFAAGGGEWRVDAVACGADGESWIAVWAGGGAALDLGRGRITGAALVKLAPRGDVAWQRALARRVSDLAPGPGGTLLAGSADVRRRYEDPGDGAAALLGPDGRPRWERVYAGDRGPRVAFDAGGDSIVAAGGGIEKVRRDGALAWRTPCGGGTVEDLGVAADGTIVAKGVFIGAIQCNLGEWNHGGPGVIPFVVALDGDGRPLWLRDGRHGPFALLPDGSAITLGGGDGAIENYDLQARQATGCGPVLERWDPATGTTRWMRWTASCPIEEGVGARAVYLSVAPGGDVWIQGDGKGGAFDLGSGPMVPEGRDWFVARMAR